MTAGVSESDPWGLAAGGKHARSVALVVACLAALALPSAGPAVRGRAHYQVIVEPSIVLLDHSVRIAVAGVEPSASIVVRATARDKEGRRWAGSGTFRADRGGKLVVGSTRSLAGTYVGRDAMGLFWSMRLGGTKEGDFFYFSPPKKAPVVIDALVQGRVVGRATLMRMRARADVETRLLNVASDRLVGTFTAVPDQARGPAVLLLGGSEGGLGDGLISAVLASHGFPTLELAYFRAPGLPQQLINVPLEYFRTALEWLGRQPLVDPGRIVILGRSRGAEAALLVGATYPERVAGVIAYAPSSVVNRSPNGRDAAWTLEGKPVPYALELGTSTPSNRAAIIPVEKIAGPVLLVAGIEDILWPSIGFADAIVERRTKSGAPTVRLIGYAAGHAITSVMPNLPVRTIGGTRAGDAALRARAWPRVLRLLGELR